MVEIDIEQKEMEERMNNRQFKDLTVGICKKLGLQPLDLVNVEKAFPMLVDIPFKFTWEVMTPLHNELSKDDKLVNDDTLYRTALESFFALINKGFLV
jgi:hypothetical protein